jgi:hypothetical protein
LRELPVEMLDLCALFQGGVCRDFSIHTIGYRITHPVQVVKASAVRCIADPYKEDEGSSVPSHPRSTVLHVVESARHKVSVYLA